MSTLRVDNIKSRTGSVLTVPESNTLAVTGIVSVTSSGSLQVAGNETVGGDQTVSGNQTITGNQLISGITTISGNQTISGQQLISGISTVTGSFNVANGINVTSGVATFAGDVSIGGTLTYEDVTNIDSVGIITARSDVIISGTTQSSSNTTGALRVAGGAGIEKNLHVGGVATITGDVYIYGDELFIADSIKHWADSDTLVSFPSNDTIKLTAGGIEVFTATTTGVTIKTPQEGFVIQDSDTGNTGAAAETGIKFADGGGTQQSVIGHHSSGSTDLFIETSISANIGFKINNTQVLSMQSSALLPHSDNSYNLGSSSKRFANLYTGDIQLCNEGVTNEVDGTWGSYTMQEGENDLFLINRRSGKKYRFNLTEV